MKLFAVLLVLVIVAAVSAVVSLFYGWALMLLWGITYSEFGWPDHTIGYWKAVGISFVLAVVLGLIRNSVTVNNKD
jgi:hypothetical protein